jgi:formylglycine-generating enzyme required for sulfatase activity/phage replication-related protein YjqB (UPF0714/DUF867 family)
VVNRIEQVFQPQYETFAELVQDASTHPDYEIRSRLGQSGVVVLAIHGGNLQPGTTQIADAVAGDVHSFYSFVSHRPEYDQTLYIPSIYFDEPTVVEMVSDAQVVLAIYGCQGRAEFVKVGGLDQERRKLIRAEFQQSGFTVEEDQERGIDPSNICNLGRTGQGVQIEVSQGLRERLITTNGRIYDNTYLTRFVAALQRGLSTSIQTVPEAVVDDPVMGFPELEPFEFVDGRLVDDVESSSFPPPLETETFTVLTLDREETTDAPEACEEFEITVAKVVRSENQWQIQRQQQTAYRYIELLPSEIPLEMIAIQSGSFTMGSPGYEPERLDRESPQHEVTVESFLMGRYPVTQAQWRVVAAMPSVERWLEPDPSHFKGDNRPVERVSWYDAMEFCIRLSVHTKYQCQYRLPTEAEWEYACRAGTTTPFHFGEMLTTDVANYNGRVYADGAPGRRRGATTPVDEFSVANAFGLSDMHGNILEWCRDYWHSNYERGVNDSKSSWLTDNKAGYRTLRGGSWNNDPTDCRSASRNYYAPGFRSYNVGFRIVCSMPSSLL